LKAEAGLHSEIPQNFPNSDPEHIGTMFHETSKSKPISDLENIGDTFYQNGEVYYYTGQQKKLFLGVSVLMHKF
jgi:hypothetical protein